MQYELTVKLLLEAPVDQDRVMRQVESLFDFGTVLESFSEALKLEKAPHFSSVAVVATSAPTTSVE